MEPRVAGSDGKVSDIGKGVQREDAHPIVIRKESRDFLTRHGAFRGRRLEGLARQRSGQLRLAVRPFHKMPVQI